MRKVGRPRQLAHGAELDQPVEQAAQAAVAHAGDLCRGDDRVVGQEPVDDDVRRLGPEFRRDGKQPVRAALELGGQIDGAQRGTRLRGEQTFRTLRIVSMLVARHGGGCRSTRAERIVPKAASAPSSGTACAQPSRCASSASASQLRRRVRRPCRSAATKAPISIPTVPSVAGEAAEAHPPDR